jgi:hypothetical protein
VARLPSADVLPIGIDMVAYQILKGVVSRIPGAYTALARKKTGGTDSARYCYAVWMRHLVMAHQNGLSTCPEVVAELGPGDSLGAGLAALLSGASRYCAMDVLEYANTESNLAILDELVTLFRDRTAIPDEKEFPVVKPFLGNYGFPHEILDEARMAAALSPERVSKIRKSVVQVGTPESMVAYIAPWNDASAIRSESVDMIFSQAVLEHVNDLPATYGALHAWLKPNGTVSNQIDFKSHGTSGYWNGHWFYSDFMWRLITGDRPYVINRQPHSVHLDLMESRFSVVANVPYPGPDFGNPDEAGPKVTNLSEVDLRTSGAYILATKSD